MGSPPSVFLKQNNIMSLIFFTILFFCSILEKTKICLDNCSATPSVPLGQSIPNIPPLEKLNLDGHFIFDNIDHAAKDFGNRYHFLPKAVLHPKSVSDVSSIVKHVFDMGTSSKLTIAAKGHGHSLHGQAQAHQGIVINMESLQDREMKIHMGDLPYVDVSGGELWINILHETLKHGLAPKSWTDYLHLTVGGTLSNAGISGQAFRHGPQIDNVYQLEVVTGKGEVITCSEEQNAELFYSVLGGLGQFGIITRARISLEAAPKKVKWIRVLYSEFSKFSNDQEHLISSKDSFNYVEGFVVVNRTGLLNNWRSTFAPKDPLQASQFISDGRTLYCLEVAKYLYTDESDVKNKEIDSLLSELSFIPSTLFMTEVSYVEFLDRVHVSEIKLRSKGLWDVPHPWLNLLIPKSTVYHFVKAVFGNILTDTSNGPILVYPMNKSKWSNRTSLVVPEEDTFYLVAFLSSAVPSSTGNNSLEHISIQNQRILDVCSVANLGVKQYLPHYSAQEEWQAHFGPQWGVFVQRKLLYDPLAILAPGQRIFKRH